MNEKQIILASPRGFCAGVNRAIDIVESALKLYNPPIYVKHEIVHNKYVVKQLQNKGVIFIENLDDVPYNSVVIFSAHGVPPESWDIAKQRSLEILDATCPLVTKVHLEAKRYAKEEYNILLIGHSNHVEVIGTLGEAPHKTTVVETVQDIDTLNFSPDDKLAYLTQTTLSVLDTKDIITALEQKFPWIEAPSKSDICYATTNRQNAVHDIAADAQMVLVIGSQNSSNSNRLSELASKLGIPSYLIEDSSCIKSEWFTDDIIKVGLTSGASVPETLIQDVIAVLQSKFNFNKIIERSTVHEDVVFQLPQKLKNIISSAQKSL